MSHPPETVLPPKDRTGAFDPWRIPNYRYLWYSNFAFYFARWMEQLVSGWLAWQLTHSPADVALIGFYRTVPMLVLGVGGGLLSDRVERRKLVMLAQVANIAASLGLFAIFVLGHLEYWHLAAGTTIIGTAWAIEWPARRALSMDTVGRPMLVRAMMLDSISHNSTRALGPFTGGVLIALIGGGNVYGLLAAFYAGSLLAISPIRTVLTARVERTSVWRNVVDGLAYARRNQAIMGVLTITVVLNAFLFPYQQLLPVFADVVLGVGAVELGLLGAADGIGSLLAAVVIMSRGEVRRTGWFYIAGAFGMSVFIFLFSASQWYGISLSLLILGGITHIGFTAMQSTIILSASSDEMRGRTMGTLVLAIGSQPIGTILMGQMASAAGAPLAVGVGGVICILSTAAIALLTPRLREHAIGEMKPARPPS